MLHLHFAPDTDITKGLAPEALKMFQFEWNIYHKLVRANEMHHREIGQLLRDEIGRRFDRPFAFLDLACGDGRFLIAAARWIWSRLEQSGVPDPAIRRRVIDNSLFGIDLDPLSICLARHAVWHAAELPTSPPEGLVNHLVTADALLDCPFPRDDVDRFDLVIGNPPFGSFSGRQAVAINPDLKQRYLARWGGDTWDTLHGMFVRRGLELARHSLALVLPTQVTHLKSYAGLRSAVTEEMSVGTRR